MELFEQSINEKGEAYFWTSVQRNASLWEALDFLSLPQPDSNKRNVVEFADGSVIDNVEDCSAKNC